MGFEFNGEEFKDALKRMNENFAKEKEEELHVISGIAKAEIQLVTPVKTGTLKRSIDYEIVDKNTSEVGTGAEAPYAEAVNNGRKTSNGGFVKGQHYMEKGLQNAEPKITDELDRWLNELFSKV